MPDASTALLILTLACYAASLVYAGTSDVRSLEISNIVPVAAALLFIPAAWLSGLGLATFAVHAATALGTLAVGFILFVRGIAGGADAKLMAAVALWTGIQGLPAFLLVMAFSGLTLALAVLVVKKTGAHSRLAHLVPWIAEGAGGKSPIPYGLAIAAGGMFALWESPFLAIATGQG